MKADRILNPALAELIARAGHGDVIVFADAGLRIPESATSIHLELRCGVPRMADVIKAVAEELVIEQAFVAEEFAEWNPSVCAEVISALSLEPEQRPHQQLLGETTESILAFVKTGECSAYASVVVVCGVSYFDEAVALHDRVKMERESGIAGD